MATGTTLLALVSMLRAELGHSQSTALGVDKVDGLKELLRSKQKFYYDEHDWSHLRVRRDVDLEAGSRYYDFPSDLDFERIEVAKVLWSASWIPVQYGIDMADYSAYDSDSDERADPMQKWMGIDAGSGFQVEVWPIPATATTLRFTGIKALPALVSNDDTAALDDLLLVYSVAADELEKGEKKNARSKRLMADRRFITLKGQKSKVGSEPVVPGGGRRDARQAQTLRVVYARE